IFVPGNERCVLVEEPALREFITRFFGEGSEDSDDAASFVAVMLLHEAGHLHYGDAGNYSAFEEDTNGGHKSLNVDKSKEKEIEFRADRFAADQLKQATSDTTNVDRFVAAIGVQ